MMEWNEKSLVDFMQFNPNEKISTGSVAKKIAMENVLPFNKRIQGFTETEFTSGTKFRNGDTLLARITPCLENGKTAFVDCLDENEVAFGSTEFIVLRAIENISDREFIYYFSIWEDFRETAIQLMTGTSGRQRVETDALKDKKFLLPPLSEQKAIGNILGVLDRKINNLRIRNQLLEDIVQAFFRKWFIENREGSEMKVSDIAILDNGSVNPGSKPLGLFYHYSIPAFDNEKTPSHELGKDILSNKFIVKENSILVSKLNPITPRIWMIGNHVDKNSVCSTEFQVLRPNQEIYRLFLYCLMKSKEVISQFSMSATGTSGSHQRIRPEYILEVAFSRPDDDLLKSFNETFLIMMEQIQNNINYVKFLGNMRDCLIPKLMSGELKVGE